MVPLFKSGDKSDVNNYRPISLLPVFSKVLEKVVYSQMIDHLGAVITPVQFGFRKKHSTVHCILNFLNNITKHGNDEYHCAVFIDLKKAFDTVPLSLIHI